MLSAVSAPKKPQRLDPRHSASSTLTTDTNRVEVFGTLIELDRLRYSPAGVPVVRFRIQIDSNQIEAGVSRKVNCEVAGVAIDREARLIASAALGEQLGVKGFLDRKSRSSTQLVLHATDIEFKKSN